MQITATRGGVQMTFNTCGPNLHGELSNTFSNSGNTLRQELYDIVTESAERIYRLLASSGFDVSTPARKVPDAMLVGGAVIVPTARR
jgi:hypothetical protein